MVDRPPRILLVDDEQSLQTLLSFPLRKDGYEVVQATDGRQALARFGEGTFDLVVLDVMMPRVDGLEVCRRLRARSRSEEHTSELQSRQYLVCRLLLEKKTRNRNKHRCRDKS